MDGLEVFRHVLADESVSARGAARENAVEVLQRHGKPVDLRLDRILRLRLLRADARIKFAQLIERKHILQALERHRVLHLLERADRLAADAPRGAGWRGILRIFLLQILQAAEHVVVGIVVDLWVVQHVILPVVVFQLACELFNLLFGVHENSPLVSLVVKTSPAHGRR